jgi:hypothetical protein
MIRYYWLMVLIWGLYFPLVVLITECDMEMNECIIYINI